MAMSFLKEKTNNQDIFIVVFAPIVKVVVAKFAQNVHKWAQMGANLCKVDICNRLAQGKLCANSIFYSK